MKNSKLTNSACFAGSSRSREASFFNAMRLDWTIRNYSLSDSGRRLYVARNECGFNGLTLATSLRASALAFSESKRFDGTVASRIVDAVATFAAELAQAR